MGYKMKGSPAKLGSIQGTSGHKSALQFNAAALTALQTAGKAVATTAGKVVKGIGKGVKNLVGKGGKGTGIKTVTNKDGSITKSSIPKTSPTDPKTGKVKMSQQVKQEGRLKKVSERRRSKGKGKSYRERMLEKKVAMTDDERLRYTQKKTEQYTDLSLRAASVALGGGGGGGYSSGGADFKGTLPSEGSESQRGISANLQETKITGDQTSGIEKANVGPPYEKEASPETEQPGQPGQKEPKDKDKYLYG